MRSLSLCCVLCLQLLLSLSLSYYSFAFPSCRPDQSSVLLDFKNSFSIQKPLPSSETSEFCDSFGTISYPKTSTWKNGTNCCLWDGVTCTPLGHVIGLNLICSWLHGKLLPNNSLFQFIHLQRLDLSGNNFDGSQISSTFSQLASLTHLSLRVCNFIGEVPSQISHLHKLVSFYIIELFNHLILKENTWERLTTNITQIKDLDLSGVDLSSIPSSNLFKNISSSLVSLWLFEVGLQGNLDEKLFSFPHLQEIHLEINPNLTGYLPKSNWSNSIRILALSYTSFTGKFPHSIGLMSSLNALSLESCQFTGELTPSLWNLTQLTYLSLSYNNFSGQISSSLSNLQNLTNLDLSSNNFIGQFPYSISELKNLKYLYLSNNGFNGTIPSSLFTLPSLNYLNLGSNQFNGYIGEISAYSLEMIDVSNNKLNGSIPRSLFHLQNLKFLNFSHNSLTGNVLLHYFSWKNLHGFDLSYNSLQGELHSSICNASNLDILNLSNNNFIGTIPHCIVGSNLSLSVLDLQMNNFSGIVPQSFEVGNNLRTLNLNGNILQGSIPQSLVNCTRLRVLDLGNNKIEDVFPHWLQALEELQVLVLRQNKLHGFIPNFSDNRSHAFPKLRVLDLSSNNLNGPLPASFFKSFEAMKKLDAKTGLHYLNYGNSSNGGGGYHDSIELIWKGLDIHLEKILTIFTSIDLSNNMFEGEIPQVIGELLALKGVNLSHNRLTGAIPASTGNLRNLEWLDLSSNKFTGKIPVELTNLNFLGVLNLSRNQLEGCIPRGQQFETFSSDSFEGNKELRGFQLMIPCSTHEEREEPLPSSKVGFEFGWKPVALGYACGAAFGATLFQLVMFSGKPLCVAILVNDMLKKRKRRVRNRP
ncbi:hypothetical protein K1719_026112 [Acacia pycnantha]|nr:hypothetical protein K1719_026112 [Acacia pycnantha]